MSAELTDKIEETVKYLSSLKSAALAYSGGLDSTFLLYLLRDSGIKKLVAFTALSPTYSSEELETARFHCSRAGVKHTLFNSSEQESPDFLSNSPDRCYYCKKELFGKIEARSRKDKIDNLLDASNADEEKDYRPGRRAAAEYGVISPLKTFKWRKEDIRSCSKILGIPGASRPQTVCLASRVPYGIPITETLLEKIGSAERFIKSLGFNPVRVRSSGEEARIEVREEDIVYLSDSETRRKITEKLMGIGFKFVSVDLEGFKSGKMNRLINK